MSALHLVRIRLDLRALVTFAQAEGVADDDHGYATHLALRRRFGTAAPQPFRLFASGSANPYLLGYGTDAAALADAAALPAGDPRLDAVFPELPLVRPMPEVWRAGARYAYESRVRPVVRYGPRAREARIAAGKHRGAERDAFLAAIENDDTGDVDREAIYAAWFIRQIGAAARVERASITGMRRLTTRRSPHGRPGKDRIEGFDAVVAGTLVVEQPDAFARMLARGIGRHAAFGFGMLALAPPRQA